MPIKPRDSGDGSIRQALSDEISNRALNGTVGGTVSYPAAKFGNGIQFDGSTTYCNLPGGAFHFAPNASWTIEFWVKTNASSQQVLIGFVSSSGTFYIIQDGSGLITATIEGMTGGTGYTPIVINNNTFHHVALVSTGGASITMYVDGVAMGTQTGAYTGAGNIVTDVPTIGGLNTNHAFMFAGILDEVAVFNSAKYSANFTPPTAAYPDTIASIANLYHMEANANDTAIPASSLTIGLPSFGVTHATTQALTWPAAQNGTPTYHYQIQVAPDVSGSPGTFVNNGSSLTTLSGTAVGLTAGTKYWFQIVVTDAIPNATTSSPITTTTYGSDHYDVTLSTGPAYGGAVSLCVPNASSPVPYNSANPTPLVIFFHGDGGTEKDPLYGFANTFCDAGYLVAGALAQDRAWGNNASIEDYLDLYQFVINSYNIGPVIFFGGSMGGIASLNLLAQHKLPRVVCWVGMAPACDLTWCYNSIFTGEINQAYGITNIGTKTYVNMAKSHSPILRWGTAFGGVRMRFYASPADTIIPKVNHTDVLQAIVATSCPESVIVVCSGEHGDPDQFRPADVLAFMQRAIASPPPTTGLVGAGGGGSVPHA